MVGTRSYWIAFLALVLAVGCTRTAPTTGSAPASQAPDAVASFYQGKTVRLVVGFPPGGGYDTYTRMIARHLGKYIPGNPMVIVENVTGAGSMVAANQVYNTLPKDGTVVANIGGPLVLEQLFKADGVQFDAAKFRYLAVPVRDGYVFVVHRRAGVTSLDEIMGPTGKQISLAGVPSSGLEAGALLFKEVLGANIRFVNGYEGTAPARLAIEGGEVDGFINSWPSSVKLTNFDDVKDGTWVVLADVNTEPTKDLPVRAPTLGQIGSTEEQRQLLRLGLLYPNAFGKVYVAAPEVPEARAQALEAAFKQAFQDPELLAEAAAAKLDIDPFFGNDIKKLVVELLTMPEATRTRLQAAMRPT